MRLEIQLESGNTGSDLENQNEDDNYLEQIKPKNVERPIKPAVS